MNNDQLNVIFEDNHLLVCLKPPGVLSQPGDKNLPDMLTIGKEYLKAKYSKPGNVFLGLVHRLDLNVGGIMAFAKTSKGASRLSKSIRDKLFHKKYYAVVEASLTVGSEVTLEDYLSKDEDERISFSSNEFDGKQALLHYKVLDSIQINQKNYSLVDIILYTGRFHQIRKQFSLINAPLVGDKKYGSTTESKTIALFAYGLSFPHPITQELMSFEQKPNFGIFSKFNL